MKFTLRQLEVFLATAYYNNISRAAESLAMSQSAASSSLKELERHFDVQLFDRAGKRLQLSTVGMQIREQAEKLVAQAKELEQSLNQQEGSGELKIGTTMTIGNDLAIHLASRFQQLHPETDLSIKIANTQQICSDVENFELDIGLIEGEINHSKLESIVWHEDQLCLFCHPDHPLANKKNITRNNLIEQSWVLRESGSGTRQSFDRVMHDVLPYLDIKLELQLPTALKQAVQKNMGIGCLSERSLVEELGSGKFVKLKLKNRDFKRFFYIIIHKNKFRSQSLNAWLETCLNNIDNITESTQ